MDKSLQPTPIVDSDNDAIQQKARQLTTGREDVVEKAKVLFYFVRDEIKYNPYLPKYLPEHFQASQTLARGEGYCVQKAVLLVALARALGIPARLGFAKIRNNLLTEKIRAWMNGDIFPWHGFAELYIEGKWVKATAAFDLKMCRENGLLPVEFDGRSDAQFPAHNQDGKPFVEYLLYRGQYDDVPLDEIRKTLLELFGTLDVPPPPR